MRWLILDAHNNFLANCSAPQDMTQAAYAGCTQTEVDDTDPRLTPPPTPTQLLAEKLAAGLTIASTATPALDGTYAITPDMQQRIQAIVAGLNAGKGLPHGASTIAWPDITGARHTFAPADFINFSEACEDYVFDLLATESALAQGLSAAWPSSTVTIP